MKFPQHMNLISDITGNYEIALANAAKGIVSIPIVPGTKVPAVKWRHWQHSMPPTEMLRDWFADEQRNIAIITTGLVIFDCDDPTKAELVLQKCGDTPYQARTPRGIHVGYRKAESVPLRNLVKVNGMQIDIRTDGGIAMIPHSTTAHGRYEWLTAGLPAKSDLPVANIWWTCEPRRASVRSLMPVHDGMSRLLYRGRKYVDTFERAVSGQSGHTTTFISALKIARFAGCDRHIAWELLLYYNATKCDPPWERETELEHKLDDALKIQR